MRDLSKYIGLLVKNGNGDGGAESSALPAKTQS
jgi:hypothetical protein